jgi:hypothetical protein
LATLMHVEVLILRLLRVAILKTEEPAAATDGCSERREMEMKGLFLSRVSVRGGDCEPGKGGLPQGQGCFSDEASRRRRQGCTVACEGHGWSGGYWKQRWAAKPCAGPSKLRIGSVQ